MFSKIPLMRGEFPKKDNGTSSINMNLSRLVPEVGQISNFLVSDSMLILDAYKQIWM